ncbi:hypothetical protein JHN63_24465 [Streptomyces sp. MBT65]|uniref:hypothetical protein n=1 Tax=Streptomyces sp. MBT65 TaxID=1488395 RepID=UPI00190D1DDF|nr:hypothetical protein [Streptomyces sp. MBT65]MBK3576900.1 hypothetical protein [Streptomyces sp. MBT65]
MLTCEVVKSVPGFNPVRFVRPGGKSSALRRRSFLQASAQPGRFGAPVDEPTSDRPVQHVAVDAGQSPPDRRFRRQEPLREPWVEAYAEVFEDVRRDVGDPLADRRQRSRPAGTAYAVSTSTAARARRTPRGLRGSCLDQPLQQARDLVEYDRGMIAELVKGTGIRVSMILEAMPVTFRGAADTAGSP